MYGCCVTSPEEGLYFTVGNLFSHFFMGYNFFFNLAFYISPKLRKGEDFMELFLLSGISQNLLLLPLLCEKWGGGIY